MQAVTYLKANKSKDKIGIQLAEVTANLEDEIGLEKKVVRSLTAIFP